MATLEHEMSRMFEEMWSPPSRLAQVGFGGRAFYFPDIDVTETDKTVQLTAELPGVRDKDIKLDVSRDGDLLTIEGEKQSEREEVREGSVFRAERRFGRFRRTIALPSRIDPDKVEARYRNGVLSVEMTKAADGASNVKRIAVKAG